MTFLLQKLKLSKIPNKGFNPMYDFSHLTIPSLTPSSLLMFVPCLGFLSTSWVVNSQSPFLLLLLPKSWWAPRKMPSGPWFPLPNSVASSWTHNLPFIPCLPVVIISDWSGTSTAPQHQGSLQSQSDWLNQRLQIMEPQEYFVCLN